LGHLAKPLLPSGSHGFRSMTMQETLPREPVSRAA
jgi:hypothetical protein